MAAVSDDFDRIRDATPQLTALEWGHLILNGRFDDAWRHLTHPAHRLHVASQGARQPQPLGALYEQDRDRLADGDAGSALWVVFADQIAGWFGRMLDTMTVDGDLFAGANPRPLAPGIEQVMFTGPEDLPADSYSWVLPVVLAQAGDGWRVASLGLPDGEIPPWL